ncbi:hypothetical protein B0H19DRAFT_1055951 [Mycena capillaripes]|nr:hypothetical protein B0H19DRAFT_1055951 [Mycena capillaripes]
MADTPLFPPELERDLLSAKRIEPILYDTISIKARGDKCDEHSALLRVIDTKPAGFLNNAVRTLRLYTTEWAIRCYRPKNPWSNAELEKILHACTGVANILFEGNSDDPTIFSMLADMRPKDLSMAVDMLSPQLDFTLPFFQNVSHLMIADMDAPETSTYGWPQLHKLCRLPALTHIALYHLTSHHILKVVLADCPSLQALMLYGSPTEPEAAMPGHSQCHDNRLLIFLAEDILEQFSLITKDGDIWARADLFISLKRQGHIEESCYRMEPVEIPPPMQSVPDPVQNTVPPAIYLHIRNWNQKIEPLLYAQIKIVTHIRNTEFNVALLRVAESKPFFANAVRHVELNTSPSKAFPGDLQPSKCDDGWSDAELSRLLHCCKGVTSLALICDFSDNRLLSTLANIRPTHQTLAADATTYLPDPPWLNLPFFQNITHLHFFDTDVDLFDADCSILANWSYWSGIRGLPALTHLAFPLQTPNTILPVLLSDLPTLQALVLLADVFADGKWISQRLPVFDPRMVVVKINWELERGSNHFWARVEAFLEQKRREKLKVGFRFQPKMRFKTWVVYCFCTKVGRHTVYLRRYLNRDVRLPDLNNQSPTDA